MLVGNNAPAKSGEIESKVIEVKFKHNRASLGAKSLKSYTYDQLEMDIRSCFEKFISADHLIDVFYTINGVRKRISGDKHLKSAFQDIQLKPKLLLLVTASESFIDQDNKDFLSDDDDTIYDDNLLRICEAELRFGTEIMRAREETPWQRRHRVRNAVRRASALTQPINRIQQREFENDYEIL